MNEAGSEESYPRDHIGDDLGGTWIAVEMHTNVDKRRSTNRDQGISPQSAGSLPILTFSTDRRAQKMLPLS